MDEEGGELPHHGSHLIQENTEHIPGVLQYGLVPREYHGGRIVLDAGQRFRRVSYELSDQGTQLLVDDLGDNTGCEFVRMRASDDKYFRLALPDRYDMFIAIGGGWLFRNRYPGRPGYWLPMVPVVRTYDKAGRIVSETPLRKTDMTSGDNGMYIDFSVPAGGDHIEFAAWTLPSGSPLFDEIHNPLPVELQSLFLWGSHIPYTGPRDLYQYMIHGTFYKTVMPYSGKQGKRSFCEVVAHALYIALHSLWKMTGKYIYRYLKTQAVFSVIARQERDGAWRHGSWTDDLEVHYRHHCGAIHMLAAYYEETRDATAASSLKKAVDFMRTQCDEMEIGKWYLHDSLELGRDGMKKYPVAYQESHALGKSPSNMLVLNTHLDALVALRRYEEATGETSLTEDISSGIRAAVAVLGLSPAEVLYRALFSAIELTFLPDPDVRNLPLIKRALRRIARQKLIPLLPRIKKMFPRIVMPNGYIDRNLSLNEFWYPYFLINIMDLLRFRMRFGVKEADPVIDNALGFMGRVGLKKWLNDECTKYGVGFWAEALYLYCLQHPDRGRAELAEAVISLDDSGQGIPPSLYGFNPEHNPFDRKFHLFRTDNDRLRTINLTAGENRSEFLIVNTTDTVQVISVPRELGDLTALDNGDRRIAFDGPLSVQARRWIRLKSIGQRAESTE